MANNTAYEMSATAASNVSVAGVSIAEGMPPSNVNDGMRAMIAQYYNLAVATAAAGTDTYTLTLTPSLGAYVDGMRVPVRFGNANATTTPTLNVSGLGAITITKNGSAALAAGDIAAGAALVLEYQSAGPRFAIVGTSGTTYTAATNGAINITSNQIKVDPTAAPSKTTPAAADGLLIEDNAALGVVKVATIQNTIISQEPSKATMQTGTDNTSIVTPRRVNDHDGVAKAHCNFTGSTATLNGTSFNVSGVVRNGAGDYTISFTTAFTDTNYRVMISPVTPSPSANQFLTPFVDTKNTGSVRIKFWRLNSTGAVDTDIPNADVVCYGRQ